ncbi:hypothetical protein ANN_18687 [Periplaneta americana]|uniref:Uncharacterized protein n=1 Tax=Periplaneta americana TaxID=6978 RepID=A0ABQ8SPF6_PERAM|nr:hypothetical protein ANN_18687 [Periplaneta americana]
MCGICSEGMSNSVTSINTLAQLGQDCWRRGISSLKKPFNDPIIINFGGISDDHDDGDSSYNDEMDGMAELEDSN